jgi:hypothetical protein
MSFVRIAAQRGKIARPYLLVPRPGANLVVHLYSAEQRHATDDGLAAAVRCR